MRGLVQWLPEPPEGTRICAGFDGSATGDFTCIRAETIDGMLFTPRWPNTPTKGMTWNPEDTGGRIVKADVTEAVHELFRRFDVERMYCDPPLWESEIIDWANEHGDERVLKWATYRPLPIHEALEQFRADVGSGRLTHDGCPVTTQHIENIRMQHRNSGRYVAAKPDAARKIDAGITAVLAHKAASDARAAGWSDEPEEHFTFGW